MLSWRNVDAANLESTVLERKQLQSVNKEEVTASVGESHVVDIIPVWHFL